MGWASGSRWVGVGRDVRRAGRWSRELGPPVEPGSAEVSFGQVAGVILGQVLWRVRAKWGGFRLLTWNFCREGDTAERKTLFQVSPTSLLFGRVGITHSFYPTGNGVTRR